MTPAGPLTVNVQTFETENQNNNPCGSFAQGSTVILEAVISANGTQNLPNIMIAFTINDNLTYQIFLGYTWQSIEIGNPVTVYMGFRIPTGSDTTLGQYTAKVLVFTNLPSQGGQAIPGGMGVVQFMVT